MSNSLLGGANTPDVMSSLASDPIDIDLRINDIIRRALLDEEDKPVIPLSDYSSGELWEWFIQQPSYIDSSLVLRADWCWSDGSEGSEGSEGGEKESDGKEGGTDGSEGSEGSEDKEVCENDPSGLIRTLYRSVHILNRPAM